MNTIELLDRAARAAVPPSEYWSGYGARLRERLDNEALHRGGLRPAALKTRHTASAIAATIAAAVAGTLLYFVSISRKTEAPVVIARTERLPPRPFIGPRQPFTGPLLRPENARPAPQPAPEPRRTPPPKREPARPDPTFLPPVRVVTIAPAAIESAQPDVSVAPSAAEESGVSTPRTMRLTNYRLLRNGVEIARGDLIETGPGGVLWFADRKGERFIISPGEVTGARPALARPGSITFAWRHDRFEWVSSTPIVEAETPLWVTHDRLAPEVSLPRLVLPAWPRGRSGAPTRGRLGAERERPLDVNDGGVDGGVDDGDRVRVGVAKSVLDVLHNKKLR